MNIRKPAAALAALTLSFGLAACGGGGQSVSEACEIAEGEVQTAMGDLSGLNPTDADAAADTISSLSDALKSIEGKVDNSEVKSAISGLSTEFAKMQSIFTDLKAAGSDVTKMSEASKELTTVSKDISAHGEKLDELCGS